MVNAKSISTHMADNQIFYRHTGFPLADPTEYRQVIGNLQYLLLTWPNIAYAVNKLSQLRQAPTSDHWQATKRILRYLNGTHTIGLHYAAANTC